MASKWYLLLSALNWFVVTASAANGNLSKCDFYDCVGEGYQCVSLSEAGYRCECLGTCEQVSCVTRPCANANHECTATSETTYECVCPEGCHGLNCSNCQQDAKRDWNICDTRPCAHDYHQCIPLSEVNYQCVCPDDCDGVNCSNCLKDLAPSACSPNPCKGDCACYESCKHAGGYYCRSDTGYLGKNCAVPVPVLRCDADKMVLSVSESFVNEYDMGMKNSYISVAPSLHEHTSSACKIWVPTNGAYEMTIPLPFSACNTTWRETGDGVVFNNQMWFNRDLDSGMFDMPVPAAVFQCTYSRVYQLVTSLRPVVGSPSLVTSKKDIFPTISLCKVPTCPGPCPDIYKVSGGASYTVGEMIHVTMSLDSGSLTTGVVDMYLSCSGESSSRSVLDIVANGCNAMSGLPSKIGTSFVSDIVCVSFQTPRTLQCTEFYIHAELMSCDDTEVEECPLAGDGSRCRSSRVKRSTARMVWLGPVVVINGSAGTARVAINGIDEYSDVVHEYVGGVIPRIVEGHLDDATFQKGILDNVVVMIFVLSTTLTLLLLISFAYVRSFRKS